MEGSQHTEEIFVHHEMASFTHCRKYKKKAGRKTIAPEFPTCPCYELARGGCVVSDCLEMDVQATATPCASHV